MQELTPLDVVRNVPVGHTDTQMFDEEVIFDWSRIVSVIIDDDYSY